MIKRMRIIGVLISFLSYFDNSILYKKIKISVFFVGNSDIFWNIEESTVQADLDVLAKFKELNTGHPDFWSYCCEQKANKCWENDSCDPDCTRKVQNRIRHLSSDVGFYLKWETDEDGYPTTDSCDAFNDMKFDYQWRYDFNTDNDKENKQRIGTYLLRRLG